MLRNYFTVALRTLSRSKVFSAINVLGLGLGLTGFIYISLFIHYEYSFDTYHDNSEDIYRLALGRLDQNQYNYAITAGVMAPVLQSEYPGIKAIARFRRFPSLVSYGEKRFHESEFYFTDSTVFEVFNCQFIQGDPKTALIQPNSIVLTSSIAMKIFGSTESLIGKILTIDNELHYEITGVINDLPSNLHFQFDYLASISSISTHHNEPLRTYQMTSW